MVSIAECDRRLKLVEEQYDQLAKEVEDQEDIIGAFYAVFDLLHRSISLPPRFVPSRRRVVREAEIATRVGILESFHYRLEKRVSQHTRAIYLLFEMRDIVVVERPTLPPLPLDISDLLLRVTEVEKFFRLVNQEVIEHRQEIEKLRSSIENRTPPLPLEIQRRLTCAEAALCIGRIEEAFTRIERDLEKEEDRVKGWLVKLEISDCKASPPTPPAPTPTPAPSLGEGQPSEEEAQLSSRMATLTNRFQKMMTTLAWFQLGIEKICEALKLGRSDFKLANFPPVDGPNDLRSSLLAFKEKFSYLQPQVERVKELNDDIAAAAPNLNRGIKRKKEGWESDDTSSEESDTEQQEKDKNCGTEDK